MERELAELSLEQAGPDFWKNPEKAARTLREAKEKTKVLEEWREFERRAGELEELEELALELGDEDALAETRREAQALARDLERWERAQQPGGREDRRSAIITVQAGAGGQDSQDWVETLTGMYAAWALAHGRSCPALSVQHAPGGGTRNATIEIPQAYGLLRPEHGVHRLSHISPRDSSGRRHTSFASVEVLPVQPPAQDRGLDMRQVDIQAFRSSGPGGQHMQKSSTAVRAVHLPTGLTAVCQSERSQIQNREYALRVLAARLASRREEEERREREEVRGKRQDPAFGNRIRSYVFLPRRFVRDHRTGFTHPNPEAVLAGDLDGFIEAWREREGREE